MRQMLILPMLLAALLTACASSEPPPLPPPAETITIFAPIDSALTECKDGPDLSAAAQHIAAVKTAGGTLLDQALKVIGIQGVMLLQYDEALADCKGKAAKIRALQGKELPSP
jgi:hypothetical protein